MRWVALLRGINVGGSRKVPMATLRSLVEGLGPTEVGTYVQSGNVVFTAPEGRPEVLAGALAVAIAAEFGFEVPVVVRRAGDLERVIAANPYPEQAEAAPKLLHVAFASGPIDGESLAAVDPARFAPDVWSVGAQEIYLRYPDGSGRSKLTLDVFERPTGLTLTARNWNTVRALHVLLAP